MAEEARLSSLGGVTIYIYGDDFWTAEPVVGTLHVLDSHADTEHYAGHHSQFRNIEFWVLDPDSYVTLEDTLADQHTVVFTDWRPATCNVKIKSLKADPMTDIKRPPDFSVFRCSARLMQV
jgi:hypothetical protein